MRYQAIDPNLFISNRQRLREQLMPGQFVVLRAAKATVGSETEHIPFRQNRDFFWATGLDEPWSVVVIGHDTEVLFIKKAGELERRWNGERMTFELANTISGVKDIQPLSRSAAYIKALAGEAVNPKGIMPALRMIKQPQEIELLKRAIKLTAQGQNRLVGKIKPGSKEYELEAELTYEYIRHGGRHAFDPIVASGDATCTLHYIDNHGRCQDGNLLLVDVGAEYANYAADVTRVFPVSGKFTQRQRQVYQAVRNVQLGAISTIEPGVYFKDYSLAVDKLMSAELKNLGLIGGTRKYFPHSVSHFLGLDVHDAGDYTQPMEAGMVITVEPGIYIPEEGIGIRLEDDILITEKGAHNLSADIPIEPDDVEALIAKT